MRVEARRCLRLYHTPLGFYFFDEVKLVCPKLSCRIAPDKVHGKVWCNS